MARIRRTLVKGMDGDDVRNAQRKLNVRLPAAARIDEDGLFGKDTAAAVSGFQKRNGLATDGTVNDQTWNALSTKLAIFLVKVGRQGKFGDPQPPGHPIDRLPGNLGAPIEEQRKPQIWPGVSPRSRDRLLAGPLLGGPGPYLRQPDYVPQQLPPPSPGPGGDRIYQIQPQLAHMGHPFYDSTRMRPWRYSLPPADIDPWGFVAGVTWRTSQEDGHVEIGPNLTVQRNLDVDLSGVHSVSPKWTVQVAGTVLWADLPYTHIGALHLASIYAQPSLSLPVPSSDNHWVPGVAVGHQASIDLVKDGNCNIYIQDQLSLSYDLHTHELAFGWGVAIGASINIPSDPKRLSWNVCKPWP
jgi:Putative peptidoglycan binding domain